MQLPWLRLLGQQEDAARLFPEYDVFLQTSWGEALSLAVVEAMAAGLPIVASDVGGTAEAVQHGVNGHIFEPGDWSSAARALQTLASSPGAWASMSHESRRLAAAKFSPERSLEDTLRSYEQALSLKRNGQR
jgi:glycosyltransferase involved in cell wall biosynthesis